MAASGTRLRIRDAMTAPAVTASPQATVRDLAELMLEHGIGSVVVVSRDQPDVPVGIVTETNFEVEGSPVPLTFFHWPRAFGKFMWSAETMQEVYDEAAGRSAESAMTTPVVTVEADDDLWEAVRVFVKHDIKRAPVLSDGRLVGVVSRRDLLKCLAGLEPQA